jgi:hypothetical protein
MALAMIGISREIPPRLQLLSVMVGSTVLPMAESMARMKAGSPDGC